MSSPAPLLLPHAPNILELIQRCLGAEDDWSESTARMCIGLLGDLSDCFPNGELKQLLLAEWIASELRNKRGLSKETKKTIRWAREVRLVLTHIHSIPSLYLLPPRWSNVQLHRVSTDTSLDFSDVSDSFLSYLTLRAN